MTESPIENARDLANWLTTFPQDITVDLVSYSRGGRRRITFDDPPGWWDRIQILAGDPVSDFVELPGAQAEAREVCNELERSSFEVHKCLRSNAGEVVQQLYGRVYKVLHLAGSCDSQREALARRYQEFSRRASPRELASVLGNLEFIATLAGRAKTKESLATAACIHLLMRDLRSEE